MSEAERIEEAAEREMAVLQAEIDRLQAARDDLRQELEARTQERDAARRALEDIAAAHGWTRQRAWETGTLTEEIGRTRTERDEARSERDELRGAAEVLASKAIRSVDAGRVTIAEDHWLDFCAALAPPAPAPRVSATEIRMADEAQAERLGRPSTLLACNACTRPCLNPIDHEHLGAICGDCWDVSTGKSTWPLDRARLRAAGETLDRLWVGIRLGRDAMASADPIVARNAWLEVAEKALELIDPFTAPPHTWPTEGSGDAY